MRDGLKRGMRNLLGVMKMFFILIVVVVSWVHTSVKTHQIIPSNCTIESNHLLYVNYNSINYKRLNFNFLDTVCGMDGRGQEKQDICWKVIAVISTIGVDILFTPHRKPCRVHSSFYSWGN